MNDKLTHFIMPKPPLDPLISAPDSNEYFNSISHLIGATLSGLANQTAQASSGIGETWA
jgi:hypothetical protein